MKLHWRSWPYLGRALIRKGYRLLTRQQMLVTPKEEEKRLAICNRCPHKVAMKGSLDQCGICGCILILKVKFADECCADRDKPRW